MAKTKAVFYWGLRPDGHVIDLLVQPDPPAYWVAGMADPQQRNVRDLFSMANVSPVDWIEHLRERFGYDPMEPTREGLLAMGVPGGLIRPATRIAEEVKESWEVESDLLDLWGHDPEAPSNLTPEQIYEVLAESRARGTPVIAFQADEADLEAALADDNVLTLSSSAGVYVGLHDPVNGYGWSAHGGGEVTIRPSLDGVIVIGDAPVFEYVAEDAYDAKVSHRPGEPLRLSTRSEEMSRLGPPPVRDLRPPKRAPGP